MNPVTLFGVDSRLELSKKMKAFGGTKTLIFADEAMFRLGFMEELEKLLQAEGIDLVTYQVEAGEPSAPKCDKAYKLVKEQKVDGVVGLGGGAAMDTAKIVCKLLANGGKADDYMGYGSAAGPNKFSPLIMMPTTSGTGSEVNNAAVCESSEGEKGGIFHSASLAIVDPVYTYGLPKSVTANTGIDALGHATENLFNTANTPHLMSDTLAMQCISLVFKWLPVVYEDGTNKEARMWMSYAALLGGYCLRLRKLTYGHSMANQLSNRCHWPHGLGASIGLAAVVRYGTKSIPEFTRLTAQALGYGNPSDDELPAMGEKIVEAYDKLQKSVGMKSLRERGIEKKFIEKMTEEIKKDTKWRVSTPPDFQLMKQSMYDSYDY